MTFGASRGISGSRDAALLPGRADGDIAADDGASAMALERQDVWMSRTTTPDMLDLFAVPELWARARERSRNGSNSARRGTSPGIAGMPNSYAR
jgi:hypothetical protein